MLKQMLELLDTEDNPEDCQELVINYLEEFTCSENGDKCPEGYYAYFDEYPEEGLLPIQTYIGDKQKDWEL